VCQLLTKEHHVSRTTGDPRPFVHTGDADILQLGYSPERLAELQPQFVALLNELSKLWDIHVRNYGLALSFRVSDDLSDD